MHMARTVPIVALLILAIGCTTWHTESVSPQEVLADRDPSRLRVTLVSGERLVIGNPRVVADTLFGIDVTGERKGLWWWPFEREGSRTPIGIPLCRVHGVATRRFSALRTGAVVGGSFAAALAIGAMALSDGCIAIC